MGSEPGAHALLQTSQMRRRKISADAAMKHEHRRQALTEIAAFAAAAPLDSWKKYIVAEKDPKELPSQLIDRKVDDKRQFESNDGEALNSGTRNLCIKSAEGTERLAPEFMLIGVEKSATSSFS